MTDQGADITQKMTNLDQIDRVVSIVDSFENQMSIKLSQQDAENKRLLETLQLGQEDIAKQLFTIISNQNKKDDREDHSASITASLKVIETEMKELPAKLLGILNNSRKYSW